MYKVPLHHPRSNTTHAPLEDFSPTKIHTVMARVRDMLEYAIAPSVMFSTLIKRIKSPERINKTLTDVKKYSEAERIQNIRIVNRYQQRMLKKHWYELSLKHCEPQSRTLIAYYRWDQMTRESRELTKEMILLLRQYVAESHSRLFDRFRVVYRNNTDDYLANLSDESVFVNGHDFETFTSIFANTIHFSDGTPSFYPWTMPILSKAPYSRWENRRRAFTSQSAVNLTDERWVYMPLSFMNMNGGTLDEHDFRLNPENPHITVLDTIKRCEDKMISLARKNKS